ncbi:DUF3429 domain-containing protein [Halomonas saccharevitans]|uniref:DUF3429 domain-containing protein n=1 Tax=Halomonas saccharevitans TaxID=416872 RepID=A0A1I6YHX4_9GAMM|nr:DUF3429 domain-containing protein [Halomonas saccharevitans]MDT8880233.1 DUF3429 domain-containing protein [Halomonas saccharevitans]SFT49992.1 Protein of unknown function [Halomonas saccharevitans]
MNRIATPTLPRLLGLAGLLPFVATAAATWLAPIAWQVVAIRAFLAYAAVILSFLGGVQWGVAMCRERPGEAPFRARMLLAMVPSLLAWPALLLHPLTGAWVLVAGFLLVRFHERSRDGRAQLPDWYQSLRTLLTLVVLACHGLVIWRLTGA